MLKGEISETAVKARTVQNGGMKDAIKAVKTGAKIVGSRRQRRSLWLSSCARSDLEMESIPDAVRIDSKSARGNVAARYRTKGGNQIDVMWSLGSSAPNRHESVRLGLNSKDLASYMMSYMIYGLYRLHHRSARLARSALPPHLNTLIKDLSPAATSASPMSSQENPQVVMCFDSPPA